ncbi:MAG TPA: Ig-like domain-containing protein, partial [Candidatus Goldiibacteriota bacterium]|nr:Ig-like domain-containing protein [Candidatus Goldiibacteriota bacterium]
LARDFAANTATVTASAPGLSAGSALVYVNDAPAAKLSISPYLPSMRAGEPVRLTIQAKDSLNNNASSNASVKMTSASAEMLFSADKVSWHSSLDLTLALGTAYVWCRDTKAALNVTITASDNAWSLEQGKAYASIYASAPASLSAWANIYSVQAGQWVTITAKVADSYGNPIADKWVSFTQMVQTGKTQNALVTPAGVSTNAQGEVTAYFRVSSDPTGSMNYCVVGSSGLIGTTVTISASGGAIRLSFLPAPMALGAGKTGTLYINAKDANGYNAPAPAGHEQVHVYAPVTRMVFSLDDGANWYYSVTPTLDASGAAQVKVKCGVTGTYFPVRAVDLNAGTGHLQDATNTITVSTGYYVKVMPDAAVNAAAGSYVTITAQVVDQNNSPAAMQGVKISFSSDNGTIYPAQSYTDASGYASALLTLSILSGIQHRVTVTMEDPDDMSYSGTITTVPVVTFSVSGPSAAFTGEPVQVLVRAKDAYGITVSDYSGTVSFTSDDPAAVLPLNYTFVPGDAGVRQFYVSFGTTGIRTITVTEQGKPQVTGISNNILVTDAPTPTPTFTFTRTPTPTITVTYTFTETPSVTETSTPTST